MPTPLRPLLTTALALLLTLSPSTTLAATTAATDHDVWYIITMDGQRAGVSRSARRTDPDAGRITSSTSTRLQVRRGQTTIEVTMATEFVESLDHHPVSMTSTQSMGAAPTTTTYTFGPDSVAIATSQGDRDPVTSTAPLPDGSWLTPAAAALFVQKRLDAGAAEITLRTIDPGLGLQPIVSTRKVLERTTAEALGKVVPAIKCSVTVSAMPGIETIEYLDERGVPIRSASNLGGIPMTVVAADPELAAADLDPPELMQRTFVIPDNPIKNPRATRRASYILHAPDAAAALDALPTTSTQRTHPLEPGKLRVTVDLTSPSPAPDTDRTDPAYLASSAMLNTADEEIRRLVGRATARAPKDDPAARAEAMRRFVHSYIRAKNLGVGFATASEVARTREGDCTEHAALLAAMLRVAGIPSRAVSGLIYADAFAGSERIFGYHMWTQALLEVGGRATWVDLDATLGPATPHDATHIALAVSALGDGESHNAMVALAPLLGRLRLTVEHAD